MEQVETSPGWRAQLELGYGLRGGKTRLLRKRQSGPLALQRSFYPEGTTCHNYILHPPGGVVGGDRLQINVELEGAAHSLLTTPGATKFYRSSSDRPSRQLQHLHVADGAILEWLPQQNIFFDGANTRLDTQIDVSSQGRLIGWEMHCFGRPANGESFNSGAVRSQTQVCIDGELRLVEQFATRGGDALCSATGLRGMAMQGNLIAAPCTREHRHLVEQILQIETETNFPCPAAVTLVDGVLVVRALGRRAEPMLGLFTRLWMVLREAWLQKVPCPPRIWAT